MMQRRRYKALAALLALAVVAAACGDDDDDDAASDGGDGGGDFTACQVTDTGGVDDRSFNQTAYKGVEDAADELGFEPQFLESQSEADFAPNIQALIDQGCTLIVTVGFLLGDATATAAEANPDQLFAIVDNDLFDTEAEEDRQLRQRRRADLLDRPGRVPGRLRGRGDVRDRHRRHLRRHQPPDRDHLHEGLRARHRPVQRPTPAPTCS